MSDTSILLLRYSGVGSAHCYIWDSGKSGYDPIFVPVDVVVSWLDVTGLGKIEMWRKSSTVLQPRIEFADDVAKSLFKMAFNVP